MFSLNDIEYGILRGNRSNMMNQCNYFSDDDPRLKFSIVKYVFFL